jgi:hypothetical protein
MKLTALVQFHGSHYKPFGDNQGQELDTFQQFQIQKNLKGAGCLNRV